MVDLAEDLYQKVNQLRQRLVETQETVDATKERVDELERELNEQRALLEAVAREEGLNVDTLVDTDDADDETSDAIKK